MITEHTLRAEFMKRHVAGDPSQCWPWLGAYAAGYGGIRVAGRWLYAHRLAWLLHRGPLPEGAHVLHRCDNKYCVNPSHLELGDQKKNTQDAWARGLIKKRSKKLTLAQVELIRNSTGNQQVVATRFGVTQPMVSRIRRGIYWTTEKRVR